MTKGQNYFLESDAGIITHPEHIETRFAFRTRILDYLWTGLPIISTKGDSLSDIVESRNLGITVNAQNADELAAAIIRMAEDRVFYRNCKDNVKNVSESFTWEKICRPLIDFCIDPVSSAVRETLRPDQVHTSVDVLDIAGPGTGGGCSGISRSKGCLFRRFFYHLFKSGPRKTLEVSKNYLRSK